VVKHIFFEGLIVFVGCTASCVHASFKKNLYKNGLMLSGFYKASPSKISNGIRLVSWLTVL